jgi:hypothetical protein
MSEGNPIRDVAQASYTMPLRSGDLVVDGVYGLDSVVDLILPRQDDAPDPRVQGRSPDRKWKPPQQGRRRPPPAGWVSPADIGGSAALGVSVLRWSFDRRQSFNRITWEMANVPCNWSLWYLDTDRGLMVQMTDQKGDPVGGFQPGSRSLKTVDPGDPPAPFVAFSRTFDQVTTPRVELHLDRHYDDRFTPIDRRTNLPIAYAFAVRRWQFTYHVRGRKDAPGDDIDPRRVHMLGFVERMSSIDWDAQNAVDGDVSTYWLSGPQPVASAVVPFYLDVRDASGNAQVIDRLRLIPIHAGPTMNVYISRDDRVGDWALSYAKKTLTLLGGTTFNSGVGVVIDAAGKGLSGSNVDVAVDPMKPFSMGAIYTPNFASTVAGSTKRTVMGMSLGASELRIVFDPSTDRLQFLRGSTVLAQTAALVFGTGDALTVAAGWTDGSDPAYPLGAWIAVSSKVLNNNVVVTTTAGDPGITFLPDTIWIGTNAGLTEPAQATLSYTWIKGDAFYTPTIKQFAARPREFVLGQMPWGRTNGRFRGLFVAILRFGAQARIGPGAGYYEAKRWIPVPRDYILKRGTIQFPATMAKFIKLEFSRLTPRPYPIKSDMVLVARDFPSWVKEWHSNRVAQMSDTAPSPVYAPSFFERGQQSQSRGLAGRLPQVQDYLESATGDDAVIHYGGWDPLQRIDDLAEVVPALERMARGRLRFPVAGIHHYEMIPVKMNRQEAFFVGLREVKAYRVDYTAADDSPEYVELMLDSQHILSSTGWVRNADGGMVSTAPSQQITSKTMPSASKYRTVQIALLGPDWESQLSDAQLSLVGYDHLTDPSDASFATSASTLMDIVTGYVGSGVGNILRFRPKVAGAYGVRTQRGLYTLGPPAASYDGGASTLDLTMNTSQTTADVVDKSTFPVQLPFNAVISRGTGNEEAVVVTASTPLTGNKIRYTITRPGGAANKSHSAADAFEESAPYDSPGSYDDIFRLQAAGAPTSAMVRIMLPDTNLGTYALRLYANGVMVKSVPFSPPVQSWLEVELGYIATLFDTDFQAEVVQTNAAVSEAFLVDLLGVWQRPAIVEVSNDAGTTWVQVLEALGDPDSYVSLPAEGKQLRVRITALRSGVTVSGWTVVPWYTASPLVRRVPIDYLPPWGLSDLEDLRATARKPMFRRWCHLFPRQYSLDQLGSVPSSGQGYVP